MQPKLSEDVIPLSDLKVNSGRVVNHAKESQFVKAIAQGLMDIEEGKTFNLTQVKHKLGINPLT